MPQSPTKPFSGIFISYRRHDCPGHAGRLADKLVDHYGEDQIFMDVDSIGPGEDFVEVIENAVGSCSILIAMIGCDWLTGPENKSRLLENANDYVRLEIATALQRKVKVIPVLVQGAAMPRPDDLPEQIVALTRKNAVELSDVRWSRDVEDLISYLDEILGWEGKPVKPGSSAETLAAKAETPSNVTIPGSSGFAKPKPRNLFPLDHVKAVRFAVWGGIGLLTLVLAVGAMKSLWDGLKWGNKDAPPASSPSIDLGKLSIEEIVARARDLNNRNNYVEAEPHWRVALNHDRFNAEYNNGLAVALYFQNKYIEAEPFFRQAVALNSWNAQYNADLGNVLSVQAKYAEAEKFHRDAVQLNPDPNFMQAVGEDLYYQKKLAEAESWFRKALAINPEAAEIQNSLGNVLYDQRRVAEAKTHYQEALRLQPGNPYFQANVKKVNVQPPAPTSLDARDLSVAASEELIKLNNALADIDPAAKAASTKRIQAIVATLEKNNVTAAMLRERGVASTDDGSKLIRELIEIQQNAFGKPELLNVIHRAILENK